MTVNYNITDRKPFVKALEEITGAKAVYKRTPTYAYEVDYFTVTREGNLEFSDAADDAEIDRVLNALAERGFQHDGRNYDQPEPELDEEEAGEDCPPPYEAPQETVFTVSMPLANVNAENLGNLLEAKGTLMKKALGIEALPVNVNGEKVEFPWFPKVPNAEEASAYTRFIAGLCEMSMNQKHISPKGKEAENEKYAFRCFLLRLGFIGKEYKTDRKILLQNLEGSSAFKSGTKKGETVEVISE